MENILLLSSETPNKCKSKETYTIIFCQKFLTQLKSRILTIKTGVIVLYKDLFFFARLNRFVYFWAFKCQIQLTRFLYVVLAGFLLYILDKYPQESWNWFVKSSIPRALLPVLKNLRRRLFRPN